MVDKDNIIQDARQYATQGHKVIGQRRKYSNQPYDVHLKAVAGIVSTVTDDPEMIAAAWLHDTIEDTPVTHLEIEHRFGKNITQLVSELSDISKPSDGNRTVRKNIDRIHLSNASSRAKTIKLADIIDNCQDICKHDQNFARTFLSESMLLLEVLTEGDRILYEKAENIIKQCAKRVGLNLSFPGSASAEPSMVSPLRPLPHLASQKAFINAFAAKDIADPFFSFGGNERASDAAAIIDQRGFQVAGVQMDGVAGGYIVRKDLETGLCKDAVRPFRDGQTIDSESSFTDVIQVLIRHDYCFIVMCGTVSGFIDRSAIQKPTVRMWLFGMITTIELSLLGRIKTTFPDDQWQTLISPARLEQARSLLKERERINHHCTLLDCLQLGDKAQIASFDDEFRQAIGFKSKREIKRTIKALESLRNNLAHSQDIVTQDWPQIIRMTKSVEAGFSETLPHG